MSPIWLLLSCALHVLGALVNHTIDDSDPLIVYAPPTAWHSSSVPCTVCLLPDVAQTFGNTYHDGTGGRLDRNRKSESDGKGDAGNDGDNDSDDINPDLKNGPPVTATVTFTGIAAYVYCIVPEGNDNDHLTVSNLTFAVDGIVLGHFLRQPTLTAPLSYLYNQPVFVTSGLSNTLHQLTITAPADSVLLFDYIVYSTLGDVSPEADTIPSPSGQPDVSRRNSVSFAVAVGASVGTLSLITIALCMSLQYRRRRSARRLREAHAMLQEAVSEDEERTHARDQLIIGPAPFVPRYFDAHTTTHHEALATFVPRYFPNSVHASTAATVSPLNRQSPILATAPLADTRPELLLTFPTSLLLESSEVSSETSTTSDGIAVLSTRGVNMDESPFYQPMGLTGFVPPFGDELRCLQSDRHRHRPNQATPINSCPPPPFCESPSVDRLPPTYTERIVRPQGAVEDLPPS